MGAVEDVAHIEELHADGGLVTSTAPLFARRGFFRI
jgi:hypothetical protein